MAAALDAVKETVTLPWAPKPSAVSATSDEGGAVPSAPVGPTEATSEAETETPKVLEAPLDLPPTPPRTLRLANFARALKEITPSSSESLGTLSDLRKWNAEFGEGHKQKKKQVWGKDRFGFTNHPGKDEQAKVTQVEEPGSH